jgi:hypothetical protein
MLLRLLDILNTAVRLQTARSILPGDRALDELVDRSDNVVNRANELGGRVSLSERKGTVFNGCIVSTSS